MENASWLRRLSAASEGDAHTLICFPHAGGSAISFGPLARTLGPQFLVLGVQYPGRQDRRHEPLLGSVADLVEGVLPELRELIPQTAGYSLFGHSMGAAVAFETCRRLEQDQATPTSTLFVSGRISPARTGSSSVHLYSDQELIRHLVDFGGTPAALLEDPEFRSIILSVTRSDYRAIETYACSLDASVECPLVALVGDSDPATSRTDLRAWKMHTTGPFTETSFPGGHFYIDANSRGVAELIRAHSARTLSN
ncbi:thioesterase [Nocardia uniformis]|uniref:Thioesterase TesA n=1 Tax=Nocardia uniformis TaxID=53432 RepID=A0A849CB88_9NOCA|nr:alpha/beta fold hydrolase [Nocardia uniformis]NNH73590.1 thioesterase [Nocardia uniformis]